MDNKAKRQRARYFAVTVAFIIISSIFFVNIFLKLYDVSRENLIHMWTNNTAKAANDVSFYLTMPMDAVAFSAVTINKMTQNGTTPEEVCEYLVNETKIYSRIISDNNTGVYAYYKGHYLDGSQWTPPDDYQPTERPWYISAAAADGRITMVEPYMNLQTFTVMMSVSQLLDDKESVVSMDIFMDGVQKQMEDVVNKSLPIAAMVINEHGYVVAHSDKAEVGKDYSRGEDALTTELYDNISSHPNGHFIMEGQNGSDIVFVQEIIDNWNMVIVISEDSLFSSLQSIYMILGISLFAVVCIILGIFMFISAKHRESVHLNQEILAIADIYTTVVQINMKSGDMQIIRSDDGIENLMGGNYKNFPERSVGFAEKISSERSRDLIKIFMDASTLNERLSDADSISQEFMDDRGKWVRLRFVVVDRDSSGDINQLLWMFESIDEDRKQQEKLRVLSETDMMTGIRNRGSGEATIRQMIAEGRQGLFLLLDADDFKSVNDNYGHAVGDKVIINIADSLRHAFRDTDVVFRLGGDEFAVYAEGITDANVASNVINRFIDQLNAAPLPELQGRLITVSIGATFYTDVQTDTFEDIYRRADEGTYDSKRHGKNYVTFKYEGIDVQEEIPENLEGKDYTRERN